MCCGVAVVVSAGREGSWVRQQASFVAPFLRRVHMAGAKAESRGRSNRGSFGLRRDRDGRRQNMLLYKFKSNTSLAGSVVSI